VKIYQTQINPPHFNVIAEKEIWHILRVFFPFSHSSHPFTDCFIDLFFGGCTGKKQFVSGNRDVFVVYKGKVAWFSSSNIFGYSIHWAFVNF
jgi:hypothetical protein